MITRMISRLWSLMVVWCVGCTSALAMPAHTPVAWHAPPTASLPPPMVVTITRPAPAPPRGPLAPENLPAFVPEVATATPVTPPILIIPMLELTSTIVPVPVDSTGWNVNGLDDDVGWLTGTGEHPGGTWGVALTAHTSRRTGTAGPFGYLWRVPLHAEIRYVWGGETHVYRVTDKRWLAPTDTRVVFVPDGNTLLLLTCDGWNFVDQTYIQRLLVIAQRVITP